MRSVQKIDKAIDDDMAAIKRCPSYRFSPFDERTRHVSVRMICVSALPYGPRERIATKLRVNAPALYELLKSDDMQLLQDTFGGTTVYVDEPSLIKAVR